MAVKAYLIRQYFPTHTLGVLTAVDGLGNHLFSCNVLELPWANNAYQKSCIPEGEYRLTKRYSGRFGWHFQVNNVPDRSGILQHAGNYTSDILGCQLPGSKFTNLNADNIPDIVNSRITLNKMINAFGREYTLIITSFDPIPFPRAISPKNYKKQ